MGALTIAELDAPAGGAGEQPSRGTDLDTSAGPEHCTLDARLIEPFQERAWSYDRAASELTDAPVQGRRFQGVRAISW
jgi:hypothetical protein